MSEHPHILQEDKKHFHIKGEKYGSSKKITKKEPKTVKDN